MRENAHKYEELGVPIVVIVGQKGEAVAKWERENPMPFPMLIDEDRSVIKAFDVYNPINIDAFRMAHPSTFLMDAHGEIVYAYVGSNQRDRPKQVELLEQVHQLLSSIEV
ncbi:peroxiredoxin [Evansella vedderi]|uniref:Peroxiredoxin n=1 Tax=Evansella vedderi TaxID=38282 RepID=A0ABU0A0E5_9BACI|nr:peroxiredoxin [Evansella vedderi]